MPAKKSKDPELEIKAKFSGEDWKDVGKDWGKNSGTTHGTAGALYFVGFVGAFIYYMQAAVDFVTVITGFFKAMVWPAIVVYKLLESFYGVVL